MQIAIPSFTPNHASAQSYNFALTSASPSTITLGNNIRIDGTLCPSPQSGVTTNVYYTRPDGTTVTTTPSHNPQDFCSGFTVDFYKPDQPGTWIAYAVAYGSGNQLLAQSGSISFTVQGGFSITVPPSTSVYQGSSTSFGVSVSSNNPQPYSAVLSVTGLPNGMTYSFSPQSSNPPFTSSLTLTASSDAPVGQYTVTITGSGGGYSAISTFTLNVYQTTQPFDFSISVSPSSGSVIAGNALTPAGTITLAVLSGTSETVTFSLSGLPSNVGTDDLNGKSCTTPCSINFGIGTYPTTPAGTYILTITATGGGKTHSATFTLIVNSAKQQTTFSIMASQNPITLGSYLDISGTITPTPQTGITTYVHYTRPDGSTFTRSTTPNSSQAGFTVDHFVPDMKGMWSVYADWPGNDQLFGSQSNTVTFNVQNQDFSVEVTTQTISVQQRSSATVSINIASISPQSYSTALSISDLPQGISYSFEPSSGNPPFSSTLTLTADGSARVDTYTITITGTGGGYIHSATFTLIVNPGTVTSPPQPTEQPTPPSQQSLPIAPLGADVKIAQGAGASASAYCVSSNSCFSPNPLYVNPGHTVTWFNGDLLSHTVTSGRVTDENAGSLFDSGLIKSGGQFQFTFQKEGTYHYFCTVYPWMTGVIIVGNGIESSSGSSTTTPGEQHPPPTTATQSGTVWKVFDSWTGSSSTNEPTFYASGNVRLNYTVEPLDLFEMIVVRASDNHRMADFIQPESDSVILQLSSGEYYLIIDLCPCSKGSIGTGHMNWKITLESPTTTTSTTPQTPITAPSTPPNPTPNPITGNPASVTSNVSPVTIAGLSFAVPQSIIGENQQTSAQLNFALQGINPAASSGCAVNFRSPDTAGLTAVLGSDVSSADVDIKIKQRGGGWFDADKEIKSIHFTRYLKLFGDASNCMIVYYDSGIPGDVNANNSYLNNNPETVSFSIPLESQSFQTCSFWIFGCSQKGSYDIYSEILVNTKFASGSVSSDHKLSSTTMTVSSGEVASKSSNTVGIIDTQTTILGIWNSLTIDKMNAQANGCTFPCFSIQQNFFIYNSKGERVAFAQNMIKIEKKGLLFNQYAGTYIFQIFDSSNKMIHCNPGYDGFCQVSNYKNAIIFPQSFFSSSYITNDGQKSTLHIANNYGNAKYDFLDSVGCPCYIGSIGKATGSNLYQPPELVVVGIANGAKEMFQNPSEGRINPTLVQGLDGVWHKAMINVVTLEIADSKENTSERSSNLIWSTSNFGWAANETDQGIYISGSTNEISPSPSIQQPSG